MDSENTGIPATMLVGPTSTGVNYPYPIYTGSNGNDNGFGGDWAWIVLLLLLAGNGWGNGNGGGFFGGSGLGYDFPWILNGQNGISNNVSDGFRDAQISDQITSVRDGIGALSTQLCGCCGDISNQLCNGFNGVTTAVTGAQNAIAQQLYSNELASLNRSFAEQTANTAGFTSVNSGVADLKYTLASEACATRSANTANTQAILDKLCALELDGYKRENDNLRTQLNMATLNASQIEQTAQIRASQATTANQLVNELRSCPIPSQPVYGNQPIFTCQPNYNGCGCNSGCGCGGF